MFDSGLEAHIAAQSVCLSGPLIQSRSQRRGLHSSIFVLPVEEDISVTVTGGLERSSAFCDYTFPFEPSASPPFSQRDRNVLYRIQKTTRNVQYDPREPDIF